MKWLLLALALISCSKTTDKEPPKVDVGSGDTKPPPGPTNPAPPSRPHDALARIEFNKFAVRVNLPIYWIADTNHNKSLDPDEVALLLFYPNRMKWVDKGAFTAEFEKAYDAVVAASKQPPPTDPREKLVAGDLDYGRATLVRSDFTKLSADDQQFVQKMLEVAVAIDGLYDSMTGAAALAKKLPNDNASKSLFRRNRGPKCVAPNTEKDPACSSIPGAPKQMFGIYPEWVQVDDKFCAQLERNPKAKELMTPFTVVKGTAGDLTAVSLHDEYGKQMDNISALLAQAADRMKDPAEAALVAYLRAASEGFKTNKWDAADEAWSKMTVDNSKWYVRAAPDETYWEPCNSKAGLHLTFARINQASREWQGKLVPVQQEMEAAIAQRAGAPYAARTVTFHLPDFIDIVVNAGDDRDPLGATIGQSLPNWGKVVEEGRGRTVAMSNLYTDPDSIATRKSQAESLLDEASMKTYVNDSSPGLLSTILHEATHNLGPAHDYLVGGKKAREVFGGALAQVMEETKAQAGALFLIEFLRQKKILTDELAAQSYTDTIVWGFGHISQGMYEGDGKPKTYSQVSAIQNGFLIEKGALVWDPKATAANGKDTGAFKIDPTKMVAACDDFMKLIAGIKARGDKAAAEALVKKFVDGTIVPHAVIKDRYLRFPKASFVYSVAM